MVLGIDVNLLAVLLAAITSMVIGFLWYGPVFGKQWIRMMKFTKKDMDKAKAAGMGKYYFAQLVSSLVMAFVLAVFIGLAGAATAWDAIVVAFWLWLGFNATYALGSVLWEGRSIGLFWLNTLNGLVTLAAMGAVIAAF